MTELDVFETRFARAYRGYLADAPAEVDAMAVAHAVAVAGRGRLAGWTWRLPRQRTLYWVVAGALLTLALVATAVIGARLLIPTLKPTGITLLNGDPGIYREMVVDGSGILWANGDGRLVRMNPADGSTTTWTIADDSRFLASDIAADSSGGVWLAQGANVTRFDGQAFGDGLVAPAQLTYVAPAPDGTLWAATERRTVVHLAGGTWTEFDPEIGEDAWFSALAVDGANRVWVGWVDLPGPSGGGIARLEGATWTRFGDSDSPLLVKPVLAIAPFADDDVWVGVSANMAHYDGSSWTAVTPPGGTIPASIARGLDGKLWIAGSANGDHHVQSYDGKSWTSYGPRQGLDPFCDFGCAPVVVSTASGEFVSTSDGIFRLTGGRWQGAWPPSLAQGDITRLLPISVNELWAVQGVWSQGNPALWHWSGGEWAATPVDPAHPDRLPAAMSLSSDATPWAVGEFGVAFFADGAWTIVDRTPARGVALARDGVVWATGQKSMTVQSSSSSPVPVWTLTYDGTAWQRDHVTSSPLIDNSPILLVDPERGLWVGRSLDGGEGGLALFDGSTWTAVYNGEGMSAGGIRALSLSTSGDLIAVKENRTPSEELGTLTVELFDGQTWTVLDGPVDNTLQQFTVASDGAIWSTTGRGPALFYDGGWTSPYAELFPRTDPDPLWTIAAAPDGTVFGANLALIVRFPPVPGLDPGATPAP